MQGPAWCAVACLHHGQGKPMGKRFSLCSVPMGGRVPAVQPNRPCWPPGSKTLLEMLPLHFSGAQPQPQFSKPQISPWRHFGAARAASQQPTKGAGGVTRFLSLLSSRDERDDDRKHLYLPQKQLTLEESASQGWPAANR